MSCHGTLQIGRSVSYSSSSCAVAAGSSKSGRVTDGSSASSYRPPSRPLKRSLSGPFGPFSLASQRLSEPAPFFFGGPKLRPGGEGGPPPPGRKPPPPPGVKPPPPP